MADRLRKELGMPEADEALVRLALEGLEKARLLESPLARPAGGERITRREVAGKLKAAGALALLLPVVTSIAAPSPAMASSGPCPHPPCCNIHSGAGSGGRPPRCTPADWAACIKFCAETESANTQDCVTWGINCAANC
jgi:hypothetical protein